MYVFLNTSLHFEDSFCFCFCIIADCLLLGLLTLCIAVEPFRKELSVIVCATMTFCGGVMTPVSWLSLLPEIGMDALGIDLVIALVLTAIAWIQFLLIPWLYNKMHWCREVRFKFVGGMDASCAAGNEKCEGCPFYKGGDCS